jgi:hypothetical protein
MSILNQYLNGTLYSWNTMILICICVELIGVGLLYINMIRECRRQYETE